MHRMIFACAIAAAVALPAGAATTRFRVTGVLDAPTGAALGLPLAAGDGFTATFTLADGPGPFPTAPLGGVGQASAYTQTLRRLDIALNTATGLRTVSLKPGKFGNSFVYDNGFSVRTGGIIDYVGFIVPVEGSSTGITNLFTTDLALAPGVFLANFSFGRVGAANLVGSTALPDLATFYTAPGATFFSLFSFRSGTAFTAAQFNALPLSEVTVSGQQVTLLPEPGTWALLIGGFAATGIAARRRRAATPAARL